MPQAGGKRSEDVDAARAVPNAHGVLLERLAFEDLVAELSERLGEIADTEVLTRAEGPLARLLDHFGCDRCTFSEFVAGDYLNVLCSVGSADFGPVSYTHLTLPTKA